MESATPKINASLRQQFISQNVSMIGKCVSVTNDRAVLEADGQVPVSFNKEVAKFVQGNTFEVIGKVQDDLSLKILTASDWGSNIDMKIANRLVEVVHADRDIFY